MLTKTRFMTLCTIMAITVCATSYTAEQTTTTESKFAAVKKIGYDKGFREDQIHETISRENKKYIFCSPTKDLSSFSNEEVTVAIEEDIDGKKRVRREVKIRYPSKTPQEAERFVLKYADVRSDDISQKASTFTDTINYIPH